MWLTKSFWDGLGALAYAMAKADGLVHPKEIYDFGQQVLDHFQQAHKTNFDIRAEAIMNLFHTLGYSSDQAYQEALENFRRVASEVRNHKEEILLLMHQIVSRDGVIAPAEEALIKRLASDLEKF